MERVHVKQCIEFHIEKAVKETLKVKLNATSTVCPIIPTPFMNNGHYNNIL